MKWKYMNFHKNYCNSSIYKFTVNILYNKKLTLNIKLINPSTSDIYTLLCAGSLKYKVLAFQGVLRLQVAVAFGVTHIRIRSLINFFWQDRACLL